MFRHSRGKEAVIQLRNLALSGLISVVPAKDAVIKLAAFSNRRPRESWGPGQVTEIPGFPLARERRNGRLGVHCPDFLTARKAGIQSDRGGVAGLGLRVRGGDGGDRR